LTESPKSTAAPALVYCRVSKKPRAGSASLESQRVLCSAHAERLGYRVSCVTQEVFSGAELFGRPALARDRADIRAGVFRALVVYSVDRLTRNEAHLAIPTAECGRAGYRVIFVAEEFAAGRADEAYAAGVERRKVTEPMHRGRRFLLEGVKRCPSAGALRSKPFRLSPLAGYVGGGALAAVHFVVEAAHVFGGDGAGQFLEDFAGGGEACERVAAGEHDGLVGREVAAVVFELEEL